MRTCASIIRLSLLIGVLSAAGLASAADIVQTYREALVHDAQYNAARATVEAGREKAPQGLAGLLPTLSASANSTYNDNTVTVPGAASRLQYNSNGYNLSLTQPLFRWQNYVQYGQAKLQVVQAEANFAQAAQDLVLRVAQAYFDVLYADENLAAVRANKEAIAQQLAQAKMNFEVGTATITDAQEAQARFDLAGAQEIAALSDLETKRYALRLIVGRDLGPLNGLQPGAVLAPPQPAALQDWVDAAERNSYAVQAQQAALEIAGKEIERARAGHYPTLDAVANYGRANNTPSASGALTDNDVRNVGVQLNIPLFQGGYVSSKQREAVANRSAAESTLEAVRRAAALAAQQAYLGVVNGLAQIRALEAALVSSQSALASNKLGYEVGVRINIDVLNAQNQVYVTRRDLAKARFDTLLAQLKLKSAVGALGEADLEQINPFFAPS